SIRVAEANNVLGELAKEFHGPLAMVLHGFLQWPFWIAFAGFLVATYVWLFNPTIADRAQAALRPVYNVLSHKYWFDEIYQAVFARGGVALGRGLWRGGDVGVIDGIAIDGSAALVSRVAATVRWMQSGYLYHYAFAMILGLIALLGGVWWVVARAGT
ncbi:MAG TPA: NADH-quinone oxidoreductase subunit L, partial [Rhodanobacteraceae bacterium]|nr:NADH-quinone oxidoreductase subunit L [Rhodanobacteraceae bacterium]